MRQYTLDGIELALKEIEHRKDCKTAAGIIRKMIVTERMRKGKRLKLSRFDIGKQIDLDICSDIARLIKAGEWDKPMYEDKITFEYKETWFNKLLKKVGL